MSGGPSVEQHIDSVDAFARTLFLRAREHPSIADAVRQLHVALRHLRVEAADPDSPLSGGAYTHQVGPLIDDCGSTLRQLSEALEDGRRGEQLAGRVRRLRDRIDDFLDAVQLQTHATAPTVNENQTGLEGIKDKVDNVAQRVFSRRDSGLGDEDSLWLEFKRELENEGFSAEVLQNHKEVLRAYIRSLESMSSHNGGAPPTVRGLLEYEAEVSSPKEMYPSIDNEKFAPSMKTARRLPEDGPPPVPPKEPLPELSTALQPRHSSSSDDAPRSPRSDTSDSMALISTRDLLAMDSLNGDMANMQLAPRGSAQQYGTSPSTASQRYLTAGPNMPGAPELAELPGSPNTQLLGSSPQVAPIPIASSFGSQTSAYSTSPRNSNFRLAPDRYGNEIPMEAQWTRINRNRVSPEVLERAGVRYEARPTYVAVLGRLSREQIEDYARQSADCRAARQLRQGNSRYNYHAHDRTDSKSSHDDEDDDSGLWDESDDSTDFDDDKTSEKGTKSYPFIVSPPPKEKGSPSATVQPKSILKNKNENHVRFSGDDPYEVEGKSPRSMKGDRSQDRDRERYRDRRRRREDRCYNERERNGGERDRDRDRDRHSRRYYDERERDYHSSGRRRDYRDGPDRDRSDRPDRRSKKKRWDTLGAVGLGGAAVSLLGVLAEAASGM